MAQKYLVQVVDDLDGAELEPSDAVEVRFGLDGAAYVIDLSTSNADTLRAALARYVDAGRRAETAPPTTRRRPAVSGKRSDLDQVRAWANTNGRPVSPRGRVPVAILDAYDASQ